MFKTLVISALIACVAVAQTNGTAPPPPTPNPGSMGGPTGSMGMPQALLSYTANIFLEWQSANAWSNFMAHLNRLKQMNDHPGDDDVRYGGMLEEDANNAAFPPTGSNFQQSWMQGTEDQEEKMFPAMDDESRVELMSEQSLSLALKIMWLQSAKKLDLAQQKHYQSKIAIAMLQTSGLGNSPQMSYLLMLMYYRSVLDSMGSMASIVRQDSWTQWNHHELIETVEFKGDSGMPEKFNQIMDRLKTNAMAAWSMETSLDIQGLFVDMYLANIVSQMSGVPGGSVPGTSFLEEEAEAEPAEQSAGSASPQLAAYWSTMLSWMNLYSRYIEYSASQSFHTVAYLQANADKVVFDKRDEYEEYLKNSGLMAWTQWAHIKQLLAYYNLFFLWYGTGGFGSMAGAPGGSLGAALGGSMGGAPGSLLGGSLGSSLGNAAVVGSALGGSMYGPYGSLLGGSLGSSL